MKAAIITAAGISGRFNEGIPEEEKILKAIYCEGDSRETLLFHLLSGCAFADRVVVVGGYQFDALQTYYQTELKNAFPQAELVRNEHYADLASGYSLYLGIRKALAYDPDEILFAEGDLDIDDASFQKVARSEKSVLTYTDEPIYANKAVVLYQDGEGRYHYAFSSSHGLLKIDEPFSCILNSGQVWKFTDMEALRKANAEFGRREIGGTNLGIIQRYLEAVPPESLELIRLKHWVNCNTREDYRTILDFWRGRK